MDHPDLPPEDKTLPDAVIERVAAWVNEFLDSAEGEYSDVLDLLHHPDKIDATYRQHFSKLRGEDLAQHSRAVFRSVVAARREAEPLRQTLYVGGRRQRNICAERAVARVSILERFADQLLSRKLPLSCGLVEDVLRMATEGRVDYRFSQRAVELATELAKSSALSPACRKWLAVQRDYWERSQQRVFAHAIDALIAEEARPPIEPGDSWTDLALAELDALPPNSRQQWFAILAHAAAVNAAKPAAKWRQQAEQHLDAVGREELFSRVAGWLQRIGEPGQRPRKVVWHSDATDATRLDDVNVPVAIGLAWLLAIDPSAAPTLGHVARASLKRIVQGQLRCEPLGNAAVRALGAMPGDAGIAQLAQLEVLIRSPKPRRLIQKTLRESAGRAGLSLTDVEETAVPDLGFCDGRILRTFDEFAAEIVADGDEARIAWIAPDGERKRVIPKQLKQRHPDAAGEVKQLAQQVESVLPAQRARIERLMKSTRTWPAPRWRERYLDHPLVSTIARRLIWTANDRPALWHEGTLRDVEGNDVALTPDDRVQLWHPIGRDVAEIVAWRDRLEFSQISQPFKQAHREVYLLTDAERRTETYSNRFAAHILKNTAMVALCQTRGWVTGLFGGQTGPRLDLPDFGVRAEFWVESAGDDYTDFGAPAYMAADQVRFYALTLPDAERFGHVAGLIDPLPLDRVPSQAFTEVMRDVDLFIGLSSVGNDPNWSDGGPDGRYRDYWHNYSFGELNASAKTRRDVLQRVIPRLEIADRCHLTDRFLRVEGRARAYKIHLGSSNILMEPNDQYLCIVPDRRADERGSQVFLPFDGDRTLSLILSKALMLAEDTKITDPTILSQLRAR